MKNIKTSDILLFQVLNNVPRVLLITRKDDQFAGGKVAIPGGHLDEGETPLEGGIRELYEETGIDVKPIYNIIKPVMYNVPNQDKYRKYNGITYVGNLPLNHMYKLTPQPNEVKDVRWYEVNQIPYNNMAFDHGDVVKFIIDKIRQYQY